MMTIGMLQIVLAGLCFALAAVMFTLWTVEAQKNAARRQHRRTVQVRRAPAAHRTENGMLSFEAGQNPSPHTPHAA